MGRIYAGILGPLAMAVVIARGVKDGGSAEATFESSVLALIGFAVLGSLLGWLAQHTIDESVRMKMEMELEAATGESSGTARAS